MTVLEVEAPAERSCVCEHVLAGVPDGIRISEVDTANVHAVAELPAFAPGEAGPVARDFRTPRSAEVCVVGLRREAHGRGLGTAPMAAAERDLRARRVECLHVKTRGQSGPDPGHARTRGFSEARGLVGLEELHGLREENPYRIMVEHS